MLDHGVGAPKPCGAAPSPKTRTRPSSGGCWPMFDIGPNEETNTLPFAIVGGAFFEKTKPGVDTSYALSQRTFCTLVASKATRLPCCGQKMQGLPDGVRAAQRMPLLLPFAEIESIPPGSAAL